MLAVCRQLNQPNWRGEVGSQIILTFFVLVLIANATLAICVARIESNSKISNSFLVKFLIANTLVAFSQVYTLVVQTYGTVTCTTK